MYVLLFLVAAAIEWRRETPLIRRWLTSGAPIVVLLLGLGWFGYIAYAVGLETFIKELKALRGEEHGASNLDYPAQLLRGLLPWTGFTVAAIVAAVMNWRNDRRVRILLIWCACILLPLLVAPQKQHHYLMPLYPPLAILTGWLVAEATRPGGDRRAAATVRVVLTMTLVGFALAALALPVLVRRFARGDVSTLDVSVAAAIVIGSIAILWLKRRGLTIAMAGFSALVALMMPLIMGAWVPTLQPPRAKQNAAELMRLSRGSMAFCFWGDNVSIPLVFELRTIVSKVMTERELEARHSSAPDLLVLSITRPARPAVSLPAGWERIAQMNDEERTLEVYRAAR